jgi:hypothetical protein
MPRPSRAVIGPPGGRTDNALALPDSVLADRSSFRGRGRDWDWDWDVMLGEDGGSFLTMIFGALLPRVLGRSAYRPSSEDERGGAWLTKSGCASPPESFCVLRRPPGNWMRGETVSTNSVRSMSMVPMSDSLWDWRRGRRAVRSGEPRSQAQRPSTCWRRRTAMRSDLSRLLGEG